MTENNFNAHSDYSGLHLFNESGFNVPVGQKELAKIAEVIRYKESCVFKLVEVAFVDIPEIIRINKEHLEREYVTDIITFRYDEDTDNQSIEGTLYCCAPRIAEQATEFNQPEAAEFKRIIIHGLLHLIGYDDRSPEAKKQMRAKEDFYLAKI